MEGEEGEAPVIDGPSVEEEEAKNSKNFRFGNGELGRSVSQAVRMMMMRKTGGKYLCNVVNFFLRPHHAYLQRESGWAGEHAESK